MNKIVVQAHVESKVGEEIPERRWELDWVRVLIKLGDFWEWENILIDYEYMILFY